MEYYSILNFKKEPFSNSPEPELFFEAPDYISCLQNLELAVRLRRGLSVITGDVGTGKTTLCRKLIQQLSLSHKDSQEIETYLLLDPLFNSIIEFLQAISLLIGVKDLSGQENEWQLKEKIKNYLFEKGVKENKIVVLIIDEGQKISENCMEILREFLNYETNSYKLLQIIIFAQSEFEKVLKNHANLADRINYFYHLKNLSFKHMRRMIKYRINVAGNFGKYPDIINHRGMLAIYLATKGYPRKVVSLCHHILLLLIVQGKSKADYFLVRKCINDMYSPLFKNIRRTVLAAVLLIAGVLFVVLNPTATINFYKQLSIQEVILPTKKLFSNPQVVHLPLGQKVANPAPAIPSGADQIAANSVIPALTAGAPQISKIPVSQATAVIPTTKTAETKTPDTLGVLTIKPGRTLWRIVSDIYGDYRPEIVEKISKINLDDNLNKRVVAGKKITFPAIPASSLHIKEGTCIVVVEKGNNFSEMYNYFCEKNYRRATPPLVFFPFWNSAEGMTFAVIIDKRFDNAEAAMGAIKNFPPSLAAKAQVLSHWDEKSVFFNHQALK